MTQGAAQRSGGPLVRKPGDVLCFYKLHEDTAEPAGPARRNERNEWLHPFCVKAKERPGIVVSVENGDVFLWMACSKGRHALRMTNGEEIRVDQRPQEFRTCPKCLVTRKKGQLDPGALGGILEQVWIRALGGGSKME